MADIFSRSQHKPLDPSLFKPGPSFEQVMNQSSAFYFSMDFTSMKYLYLSSGVKKVLGYEQKEWFRQGLPFLFNILQPNDREALRRLHLDMRETWLKCSLQERQDISFNFDYRVFAADGQLVRLNQHSTFLAADPQGFPLVDFSVCTDISSYKSTGPVSLHIKKGDGQGHQLEKHITYDEVSTPIDLSGRELEVIKLLSEGLTSRQVSQRLFISQHTVRTHRKNILKKANCSSTVELINLAKNRGMLRPAASPLPTIPAGTPDHEHA